MLRLKLFLVAGLVAPLVTPALAARGTDGTVNILFWQAPSMLNPYLSGGVKDYTAASLVLEPLASYDENGRLFPRLAQGMPSVENGSITADLKSITWKLKPDLKWSDGSPVTARDVSFTANYCMDPKGGCASFGRFQHIEKVETPDELTIKVTFKQPMPVPYAPFVGATSPIIQAKQFAECLGDKAPTCTEANFHPIGTGPFIVTSFKPNDSILLKANPHYRDPDKPAFAEVNFKGGGDALAAARAVLQTGEYDYGWNLQLAPDVLKKMEEAGKGKLLVTYGTTVETLYTNLTDPSPGLAPDERSTTKHPNPILGDVRVRKALSMAIDRATLAKIGYGFMGRPTCDWIPAPKAYAADNTSCLNLDIAGAGKLLDDAGWKLGGDGVREKDGKKLKLSFQTSTNTVRQQFQAIMKQWWRAIGVDVELRNINGSVFFGSDPGSPDTALKFYADLEMYADGNGTDPGPYAASYTCTRTPRPETQWQGANMSRYCDKDYDALVAELGKTADVEKRAEIIKSLNNKLTVDSYTLLPLVWRASVSAISTRLGGEVMTVWDSELWNAQDWYRKK